jgi:predicted nuclease of restriction endonuclease-like (RecB) superfamily
VPAKTSDLAVIAQAFPLPWSAYVKLLSAKTPEARRFYETEALRNGWTVRQLDRQINSLFYERTALSRDRAAMLGHAGEAVEADVVSPEEAIKDPLVLEFLGLKDEYSETDLEDALITHLAEFLLELGDDFAFVGRQRRLRLDDNWFRVDLVLFNRRLRCLVLIELKIGKFSYQDAGQMTMYLNYAKQNWVKLGENPPAGIILCSDKGADEVRYSLESLGNAVLAAEYRLALPDAALLEAELAKTRQHFETHAQQQPQEPSC